MYSVRTRKFEKHPKINLKIKSEEFSFIVDTGSNINTMPENIFTNCFGDKITLNESNSTAYPYASNRPIEIIGKFVTAIEHLDQKITTEIYVFRNAKECLLSYESSVDLGIIRFCDQEIRAVSDNDNIMK